MSYLLSFKENNSSNPQKALESYFVNQCQMSEFSFCAILTIPSTDTISDDTMVAPISHICSNLYTILKICIMYALNLYYSTVYVFIPYHNLIK